SGERSDQGAEAGDGAADESAGGGRPSCSCKFAGRAVQRGVDRTFAGVAGVDDQVVDDDGVVGTDLDVGEGEIDGMGAVVDVSHGLVQGLGSGWRSVFWLDEQGEGDEVGVLMPGAGVGDLEGIEGEGE